MADKVYLIDASNFIHRAYHAIRSLSTRDGRPTNAVFGFVAALNKLLSERSPRRLVVVYDPKGPSFRREMYEEYKANRPPMPEDLIAQQKPIREIVRAMGLPALEVEGLEADDVIATLAAEAVRSGREAVIVSSDKDFYQILGDRVEMYDPNPRKESLFTAEMLREKLGLTPAQFLEAQGLMGDSTDNIPGVPGIGEKTAARLIGEYGDLETLYDRLDEVKGRMKEKLAEHREAAFLSRDLARLKRDADLPLGPDELVVCEPDAAALREIYRDLEFNRFLADLEPSSALSYDRYELIADEQALEAMLEELAGARRLAVDTETTSLNPIEADLVGVSLCAEEGRAFYIPVGHTALGSTGQPERGPVLEKLRGLLEAGGPEIIGQNLKYDYIVLARHGLELDGVDGDPMIASYLLDQSASHNLDDLSRRRLGHSPITYLEVVGDKRRTFDTVTPEAARDYACEDADLALRLETLLRDQLAEEDLLELYQNLELPLIPVLARMETAGIRLDEEMLGRLSSEFADKLEAVEERIHELAGRKFNINSPKQLGEVLFEDLGLPQGKKTAKKTGYSTDVEVLTSLAEKHDLPAEILNYRGLAKLKSTYVDALAGLTNPRTGRVHTSFNQTVTATGRLSSSDPNLQNIPIRTEEGRRIRQAFVPAEGCLLVSADYSQIELRIMAHYSGDRGLTDAFAAGEDIHTRTASEVFGLMPGMITPDMRREAKTINFGIVYGQQAYGLARQLGIERKRAKEYIDRYFERYRGVKDYMERTLEQARSRGFVTTMLGRRRLLPDINARNANTRGMAERMAINTPIQGTAADIIKLAMLAVDEALQRQGLKTRMLLQVHDELVFEAPEDEVDRVEALAREKMEGVLKLDAPLVVDVGRGRNWDEAH